MDEYGSKNRLPPPINQREHEAQEGYGKGMRGAVEVGKTEDERLHDNRSDERHPFTESVKKEAPKEDFLSDWAVQERSE